MTVYSASARSISRASRCFFSESLPRISKHSSCGAVSLSVSLSENNSLKVIPKTSQASQSTCTVGTTAYGKKKDGLFHSLQDRSAYRKRPCIIGTTKTIRRGLKGKKGYAEPAFARQKDKKKASRRLFFCNGAALMRRRGYPDCGTFVQSLPFRLSSSINPSSIILRSSRAIALRSTQI